MLQNYFPLSTVATSLHPRLAKIHHTGKCIHTVCDPLGVIKDNAHNARQSTLDSIELVHSWINHTRWTTPTGVHAASIATIFGGELSLPGQTEKQNGWHSRDMPWALSPWIPGLQCHECLPVQTEEQDNVSTIIKGKAQRTCHHLPWLPRHGTNRTDTGQHKREFHFQWIALTHTQDVLVFT